MGFSVSFPWDFETTQLYLFNYENRKLKGNSEHLIFFWKSSKTWRILDAHDIELTGIHTLKTLGFCLPFSVFQGHNNLAKKTLYVLEKAGLNCAALLNFI